MKIVLHSDNGDLTYTFSRPLADGARVDVPTDRVVREISITYSDTAFEAESQSTRIAPEDLARAAISVPEIPVEIHADLFGVDRSIGGPAFVIPERSAAPIDLIGDVLRDVPKEVRDRLSVQSEYMNFAHLVESIRTNPEHDMEHPLDWPVQTLIDCLHRRTPGDVTAEEALKLAAKANRALLGDPDIRIRDGNPNVTTYKSLLSPENSFTLYIRDTSRGEHRLVPNLQLKLKDKGPSTLKVTSCTSTGGQGAEFKALKKDLDQISAVVTQFLNKILDPEGILDVLALILAPDVDFAHTRGYLSAALETRVSAGAAGRLSEETVRIVNGVTSEIRGLASVLIRKLSEVGSGLASRKAGQRLVEQRASTELGNAYASGIAAVLITDMLVVIYPVISALAYRILYNLHNALARLEDPTSPISPSYSHLGPHLVVTHKTRKAKITVAHPLMDDPHQLKAKLTLGKKRATDLLSNLTDAGTVPEIGVPSEIKFLFILADPQIYTNIHLCPVLSKLQPRMQLERCLKASLGQLSAAGNYVVAYRKPLEQEELIAPGGLVTRAIYHPTMVPQYRWSRRGSSSRMMVTRPHIPPDRGILGARLEGINTALRHRTHLMKSPLDCMIQVWDNRTFGARDTAIGFNAPLRHIRLLRTHQYDIDSYAPVTLASVGTAADFASVRWFQDFSQYMLQVEVFHQGVPAIRKMAKIPGYKLLLCSPAGSYYDRPYYPIAHEQVQGSTCAEEETPEAQFQRMLKTAAWYDMPRLEEVRESVRQRPNGDEFKYGIIGQTPDASRVLYPAFSFYLPDAFHFNYMWAVLLGEMLPASSYVMDAATTEEQAPKEVHNYIPDEYSKAYRKSKKERIVAERKRALDELRRMREEYATYYRNKIPHLRRRNTEVTKMLQSGTETLGEEHALQQALSRGQIEGFRVINGELLLKMPEVNIYEKGLIYNIGKLVVSIKGFDGAHHYDIRFYNISHSPSDRSDSRTYDHPHVRGGKACLGNVENMLSNAIQNDDLLTVVELCKGYLNAVNSADTFGQHIFTKWPFALPTVHNLIKFGIAGQITGNTCIALYRSTEGVLTVQKAKDIPYFKIRAEFDALMNDAQAIDQRESDFVVPMKNLPNAAISILPAAELSSNSKHNGKAATTMRSDAEIRRSFADFQTLVSNQAIWNAAVGRRDDPEIVDLNTGITAVA